jgi:hypothetical protein
VVLALFLALCVACGVVTDRVARRWAGTVIAGLAFLLLACGAAGAAPSIADEG